MATYTKANDWIDYAHKAANLSSDTLMFALSNTAPASETPNPLTDTNGILTNVTQISYTNYTDDMTTDRTLESVTASQTSGTFTLDAANVVITASGGAIADFRYIYVYDDTVANDPIIAVIDYGSTISLADGDSATIAFNASGIYTAA